MVKALTGACGAVAGDVAMACVKAWVSASSGCGAEVAAGCTGAGWGRVAVTTGAAGSAGWALPPGLKRGSPVAGEGEAGGAKGAAAVNGAAIRGANGASVSSSEAAGWVMTGKSSMVSADR